MSYDLLVIGGGPAGYVGAIRATQLGKKVACIDAERAGGTCLNWGCIPTKALLKNAELYQTIAKKGKEFGIQVEGLSYDWDAIIGRSRKVSQRLAGGIEFLFKKNKVDYFVGEAEIKEKGKSVKITDKEGKSQTLKGSNILICTGCIPRQLPDFPFNGKTILSSKDAMILKPQPKELVIIGAGAIGVEFAYIYNVFGTKVTLIEMQSHLLPVEDEEVGEALRKSFVKQGIRPLINTKTTEFKDLGDSVEIKLESSKGEETIKADACLVAIGVEARLPDGVDLELERGFIQVDENYQSSVADIYAAGDIIGPPWLAHTASFEAIQCVEGIFLNKKPKKVENFPGCTYCHPQVASVGKTEATLKAEGLAYKVGKFPFQAIGKAQAVGATEGFVKLLFGEKYGELLGAHIIGENATELIAEMGLGLSLEATIEDIHSTIHAHPTLAEAIHEASLDVEGNAIHS